MTVNVQFCIFIMKVLSKRHHMLISYLCGFKAQSFHVFVLDCTVLSVVCERNSNGRMHDENVNHDLGGLWLRRWGSLQGQRSLAATVYMSKCPWARDQTPSCPSHVFLTCKLLWIKASPKWQCNCESHKYVPIKNTIIEKGGGSEEMVHSLLQGITLSLVLNWLTQRNCVQRSWKFDFCTKKKEGGEKEGENIQKNNFFF